MTSKQLDIDDALIIAEDSMPWDIRDYETSAKTLAAAYRAKCAEVEELRKELATPVLVATNRLADALADSRAEVEELRKALRMIAEWKPGMTYGGNVFDAQEIARKALEGKE